MTLPALFKRAGALGVALGLLVGPLAMAQQDDLDKEPGAAERRSADSPTSESEAPDEPGFGSGTEPMPGTSQPGSDPAQQAPEEETDDGWEQDSQGAGG
ncbi:hypothetical protein SAMN04487954_10528 [Billgrantia gudaonensis]|uniref:Uncharacterized protein n=2 Tax=Billgrantia gudaonensis TaxID=376427 RepID=A0A1G8U2Z4_9GAMM|nr:hypothetical protein SAMN04487954_10528 [Halomonas gudaonensis]